MICVKMSYSWKSRAMMQMDIGQAFGKCFMLSFLIIYQLRAKWLFIIIFKCWFFSFLQCKVYIFPEIYNIRKNTVIFLVAEITKKFKGYVVMMIIMWFLWSYSKKKRFLLKSHKHIWCYNPITDENTFSYLNQTRCFAQKI